MLSARKWWTGHGGDQATTGLRLRPRRGASRASANEETPAVNRSRSSHQVTTLYSTRGNPLTNTCSRAPADYGSVEHHLIGGSHTCMTTGSRRLLSSGRRVVRVGGAQSRRRVRGGVAAGTRCFPDRVRALSSLMFSALKTAVAGGTFPWWGESRSLWWSAVRSSPIFYARLLSLSMP